jgi:hypothetical protein
MKTRVIRVPDVEAKGKVSKNTSNDGDVPFLVSVADEIRRNMPLVPDKQRAKIFAGKLCRLLNTETVTRDIELDDFFTERPPVDVKRSGSVYKITVYEGTEAVYLKIPTKDFSKEVSSSLWSFPETMIPVKSPIGIMYSDEGKTVSVATVRLKIKDTSTECFITCGNQFNESPGVMYISITGHLHNDNFISTEFESSTFMVDKVHKITGERQAGRETMRLKETIREQQEQIDYLRGEVLK